MQDPTKPLADIESNNSKRTATPASWKPGQSGNPKGRPKEDWTWRELFKDAVEEFTEIKKKDGSVNNYQFKKLIVKKLLMEAAQGNIGAMRELFNRMDGMPKQQNELSGNVEIVTHRAPVEKP